MYAGLVTQTVKNLPAVQETWVQSLERSPGEGNGNPLQYSCLESSMNKEPVRLRSMGSHRVRQDLLSEHTQSIQ